MYETIFESHGSYSCSPIQGPTLSESDVQSRFFLRPPFQALEELMDLPPNWDSYGARPTSPKAIISASELISMLFQPITPGPSIVPTNVGGVQLEWHEKDIDLEISVGPDGARSIYFSDLRTQTVWEDEAGSDLRGLAQCLSELCRRRTEDEEAIVASQGKWEVVDPSRGITTSPAVTLVYRDAVAA